MHDQCVHVYSHSCVNRARICVTSALYVDVICAKKLYIINSAKESSAIIHFTLLLLALHSFEGISEQPFLLTYLGKNKCIKYMHAHLQTRPVHNRIWPPQCSPWIIRSTPRSCLVSVLMNNVDQFQSYLCVSGWFTLMHHPLYYLEKTSSMFVFFPQPLG